MNTERNSWFTDRRWRLAAGVAALALGLALAGCSDDPANPGTTVTLYVGTFAASGGSGSESGTLQVNALASATGSIDLVGAGVVNLTGTTSGNTVTLGGGPYSLAGTTSSGLLTGTYTGPKGPGRFAAFSRGASETVTTFCGSYTGDSDGVWNLIRRGTSLSGIYADDVGGGAALTGSINASNQISLTFAGGTASGTLAGTAVSGTWVSGADNGTWSGNTTC